MILGSKSTTFYYTLLALASFWMFSFFFIYIMHPFELFATALDQCYLLTEYIHVLEQRPYFSVIFGIVRHIWRPLVWLVILPAAVVALFYSSNFIIQIFKCRLWFYRRFQKVWDKNELIDHHHIDCSSLGKSIDVPLPSKKLLRELLAGLWDIHGKIYHGYEVSGMEKIPIEGPAIIIYYHGTLPLDVYHFMARMFVEKNKRATPIVDRFLMKVPGIQAFLKIAGAETGSIDTCVTSLVEKKEILMIAPGGSREALFSDENYDLIWGSRTGFAKIALQANLPVYPMHTMNIREPIRVVKLGRPLWRWIYETTRLPIAIFYGYFPVKLKTFIGDPIYPAEFEEPEEFVLRAKEGLEELIRQHQTVPGSIFRALIQRLPMCIRSYLINE